MPKSVLITGASSGIGAAAALEFSRRGHFVFLLGRNASRLSDVQRRIPESTAIQCDLGKPPEIETAVSQVLSHPQGRDLEILVNNAGIYRTHDVAGGSDPAWSDSIWEEQFNVNLFGPVRLTRGLWKHFSTRGRGSIVNVSSTLGMKPTAHTGAYSASKAALINWTQSLALEGGPLGIRANAVSPGMVDTPIHGFHSQPPEQKARTLESLKNIQPLGRIGTPEEIAKAIVFLGTEDSSWTTGANLAVDGGIFLS